MDIDNALSQAAFQANYWYWIWDWIWVFMAGVWCMYLHLLRAFNIARIRKKMLLLCGKYILFGNREQLFRSRKDCILLKSVPLVFCHVSEIFAFDNNFSLFTTLKCHVVTGAFALKKKNRKNKKVSKF